jgi:hypothetical protein
MAEKTAHLTATWTWKRERIGVGSYIPFKGRPPMT